MVGGLLEVEVVVGAHEVLAAGDREHAGGTGRHRRVGGGGERGRCATEVEAELGTADMAGAAGARLCADEDQKSAPPTPASRAIAAPAISVTFGFAGGRRAAPVPGREATSGGEAFPLDGMAVIGAGRVGDRSSRRARGCSTELGSAVIFLSGAMLDATRSAFQNSPAVA